MYHFDEPLAYFSLVLNEFDPAQKRDKGGKWAEGGGRPARGTGP